MQLYFVRHGESEANLLNVFSNRDAPHGLTERGRAQVEALADKLAGIRFDAFYSSPILRARESAAILAARLGIAYTLTPALLEYDVGVLEGRCDPESWRHYDEVREAWFRERRWEVRTGGGESFEDIRRRFVPFVEQLTAAPAQGATLLLGHGGTFTCMLPLVLANIDFSFVREHGLGHTEYVLAERRGDALVCVQWGAKVFAEPGGRMTPKLPDSTC